MRTKRCGTAFGSTVERNGKRSPARLEQSLHLSATSGGASCKTAAQLRKSRGFQVKTFTSLNLSNATARGSGR
uniref:Uncharacterized protein n=1 Tax=Globisporangium ultimum (strain ATCC 200006 / CBS 805.95 / DAOM BR144) TaxID=431595 RepID=K3X544_GLOUD